MNFTIDIAGRHVPWTLLLLAVVALLWVCVVAVSLFSRTQAPKKGLRTSERNLIAVSIFFAAAWGLAFDGLSLVHPAPAATQAAMTGSPAATTGSCPSLPAGMSPAAVTAKIGKADQGRNPVNSAGPRADTWISTRSPTAGHTLYRGGSGLG